MTLIGDGSLTENEVFKNTSHVLSESMKGMEKDELAESLHDPFFRFGLGIYNYMNLQKKLILFLGYMSIVSLIQMGTFYMDLTEKDIDSIDKTLGPWEYISSRFSLGSYY